VIFGVSASPERELIVRLEPDQLVVKRSERQLQLIALEHRANTGVGAPVVNRQSELVQAGHVVLGRVARVVLPAVAGVAHRQP